MSELFPNHNNQYIPTGSVENPSYVWFLQGPGECACIKPTRHPISWDVRNITDMKNSTYYLAPEFQINVLAFMDNIPYPAQLDERYPHGID